MRSLACRKVAFYFNLNQVYIISTETFELEYPKRNKKTCIFNLSYLVIDLFLYLGMNIFLSACIQRRLCYQYIDTFVSTSWKRTTSDDVWMSPTLWRESSFTLHNNSVKYHLNQHGNIYFMYKSHTQ